MSSVLLAVGISGCLSTLAVAARFRERAAAREELAAAAQDRIGWFLKAGCVTGDTAGSLSDPKLAGHWSLRRDSADTHLALGFSRRSPLVDEQLALTVVHPC